MPKIFKYEGEKTGELIPCRERQPLEMRLHEKLNLTENRTVI